MWQYDATDRRQERKRTLITGYNFPISYGWEISRCVIYNVPYSCTDSWSIPGPGGRGVTSAQCWVYTSDPMQTASLVAWWILQKPVQASRTPASHYSYLLQLSAGIIHQWCVLLSKCHIEPMGALKSHRFFFFFFKRTCHFADSRWHDRFSWYITMLLC